VRAKEADSGWLLECTSRIVERARAAGEATVIVNDRADVARLSGASGVHVGQDDLSPRDVRAIGGDQMVVGLSTHTPEQLARAVDEPISHVAIGPVFGTVTKETGYSALGLERVRDAHARVAPHGLPLVAIGGITLERAVATMASGADAVAIISDLITPRPDLRVREYLSRLAAVDTRS
jgi:thiamine-phosphate pyrophosphorylase